jgi:hypothetical protein
MAVRSELLFALCTVIRTCATGCLLAESRMTPATPPDDSVPRAGMGNAASEIAMQAGTKRETTKLRVI